MNVVPHKDYTTKQRAEPISFGVDGQKFLCVDHLPARAIADVALSSGKKDDARVKAILQFLDMALIPDSAAAFADRMRGYSEDEDGNRIAITGPAIDLAMLLDIWSDLLEAYGENPTGGSSASPAGSTRIGQISGPSEPTGDSTSRTSVSTGSSTGAII